MNISNLNIGIIHSLIGKNDGVSIVIDQTVHAMVDYMDVSLGNIYFLAAHSSPRFNAQTDEVFWHKNEIHTEIIASFCQEPDADLDQRIHEEATYAKNIISKWVDENNIDLIIAHNTSHPYNFITSVALGYYFEELHGKGVIWPKQMVWWHDSYFERDIFSRPNHVVKKYLKYLPGTYIDGVAFINHQQIELGKKVFSQYNKKLSSFFFENRAVVVPNTSAVEFDYTQVLDKKMIAPDIPKYNQSFWKDCGLLEKIEALGFDLENTKILLQHTRIVPRKKIETAIELAFKLEQKFRVENNPQCLAVVVTGHSGDEQNYYKKWLNEFYEGLLIKNKNAKVVFLMVEGVVLSHRDIIVDRKYYKFGELPNVFAAAGAIGTYFSDVEGFGNNLLELMASGVPAVINRYETFKTEIEHLGFKLPSIDDNRIDEALVNESYKLLTDMDYRNQVVKHNLDTLKKTLGHHIIAKKLTPLITDIFTKKIPL